VWVSGIGIGGSSYESGINIGIGVAGGMSWAGCVSRSGVASSGRGGIVAGGGGCGLIIGRTKSQSICWVLCHVVLLFACQFCWEEVIGGCWEVVAGVIQWCFIMAAQCCLRALGW